MLLTRHLLFSRAAKLAQRQASASGLGSQFTLTQRPAGSQQPSARDLERERMLAPVLNPNRAHVVGLPNTYTVAPKSTFDGTRGPDHRHPVTHCQLRRFAAAAGAGAAPP